MPPIITAENIWKSFGKYSILEDLSLQVDEGLVYGLVGLNGAGKTTLLRLLLGNLRADSGNISVRGFNPWEHREEFYRGIGVVLEHDGFWGNLTVRENLSIYAAAKGISAAEAESYFAEYWKDTDIFNSKKKVKYLSRGQKMQCAICRAFLGWPKVLFLDEPVVALDITAYDHFCRMVREARDRGAAMIISSHQLEIIDKLCGRIGVLRDKHLVELNREICSQWAVVTDDSPQWKSLIEKAGGLNIIYDGYWRFEIDHPDTAIPELISSLVSAGCRIREVRQERDSAIGDAVRGICGNGGISA
ncbi:MAG: ABC transporter ATP-binding protein [Fibrobacter sp.]|jgi:ABC-2 type transport system ATP-binding protein|nr:ABC transporter ATP-binding protein [Fibrobacter sp.]